MKMSVIIETTLGDITIDLYTAERPRTCLNFLKLCKIKYYNFCLIHSIQRNFLIQMGDPLGTGRGGESIFCKLYGDQAKYFDAEVIPKIKHHKLGTVSMVNNGQNMHGSQFFITAGEDLDYLDGVHTVFGEVTEGFEILMKINDAICDEHHRPYKDIRITHTVILDDPFDDPKGLEVPDRSPELTEEQLRTERIGVDEDIDDTAGKTLEEVEEEIKDKEAKARATILEMVGDLPEADVKPPETVLFVCKLNPVTTDEDLEIIFSRFGPIVSCEVVRDKKTGESLQYAFIEFEKEEDCENAYFKMDNVLIDDRRIHVDFSQSVSKLKYDKDNSLPKKPSKSGGNALGKALVLKDTGKIQGNYSMVFNDDDDLSSAKGQQKKRRHSSSSSSGSDRNRARSTSSRHHKKGDRHYQSHKDKDRRHRSDNRRRDSYRRHRSHSSSPERHSSRRQGDGGLHKRGHESSHSMRRKDERNKKDSFRQRHHRQHK